MALVQLSNELLEVAINPLGAELQSLLHKGNGIQYLWHGDPAYWGKHSPVLFPIVGGLKDQQYAFEGKSYQLGRHGFARERFFSPVNQSSDTQATFSLISDESSLAVYPFRFVLDIVYTLENNSLAVDYRVHNMDDKPIYFSIGAHPAFAVPFLPGSRFEDYYLRFAETENTGIWPLADNGLVDSRPIPFLQHTQELALNKSLFAKDALVFKSLRSTSMSLLHRNSNHGLTMHYTGFPYMGIWSTKGADFVCLEPWCGIADSVDANGDITRKEGIHQLGIGQSFERSWRVILF